MNIFKSNVVKALLILCGAAFFHACEDDFRVIGADLIGGGDFQTRNVTYEVSVTNSDLSAVRTNGLNSYQLGDLTHPIFGRYRTSFAAQLTMPAYNPIFGNFSQSSEDTAEGNNDPSIIQENERVTRVYLNLPFFAEALEDTTQREENEPIPYRVDSVFGNRNQAFTLKVYEFTKYLRSLDPSSNFQDAQDYFSDEDPSPFLSTLLFDDQVSIVEEEILIFEGEDNPETPDVDESQQPSEVLTPRLRVELDPAIFQEKILDNEGELVLSNANNFLEFFRGIFISVEIPDNNLAMLLDTPSAYVEMEYEYDDYSNNGTTDDTSDDFIDTVTDTFRFNMGGNLVNYIDESTYPEDIVNALNSEQEPERIYLRGGSGTYAEIDITGGQPIEQVFGEAIAGDWLINEANLIFYLDEEATAGNATLNIPDRLFLYDAENQRQLVDYTFDLVGGNVSGDRRYAIFDGRKNEEDETGIRYRFRITEHLNNIIRNDSTNVRLGLSLTSNISNGAVVRARTAEGADVSTAQAGVVDPRGTILFGSVPGNGMDVKRVRLEVLYTEPK
ncbi:DUF4270 domain-containing protein [Robertkochia aurantiaca]|uniref:DUF4270 domain-containing protein n=1 Tax=Robertkochia aurantiaca TaxID=2873700 RepID=UPI001CC9A89F|nr:DUF4270 domain-containing protein [Robertkochia sp. 3YJGBD-33]